MKEKYYISDIEKKFFRKEMKNVKPLIQDNIKPNFFNKKYIYKKNIKKIFFEKKIKKFNFSDIFEPIINNKKGFIYNFKLDLNKNNINKIIKKNNYPRVFIDLHGNTKIQAKNKLEILIEKCIESKIFCICIIHGHGKNILKKHIPFWLAQHPNFLALYKAPKNFGGKAALFLIIKKKYKKCKFNKF